MTLGPLMIDVAGAALSAEDRDLLRHPAVGSVILFSRNYRDPAQLARAGRRRSTRCAARRCWWRWTTKAGACSASARASRHCRPCGRSAMPTMSRTSRGLDLARQHGWLMAAELLACGVDFSFAPCVDLDYGLSAVIGDRALHPRAGVVAALAAGLHAWHARCRHGGDRQAFPRSWRRGRRLACGAAGGPPRTRRPGPGPAALPAADRERPARRDGRACAVSAGR